MSGTAACVAPGEESERGLDLLAARFPFFSQFRGGAETLSERLRAASVYRFDPGSVTLIDNSRGFGFKRTLVGTGD